MTDKKQKLDFIYNKIIDKIEEIIYFFESLIDTYRTERKYSGIGVIRAVYRAVRCEITGKLYPS